MIEIMKKNVRRAKKIMDLKSITEILNINFSFKLRVDIILITLHSDINK